MRSILLIAALSAGLAACATDGAPAPQTVAAAGDPCRLDGPLELSDPRAESVFGCANAINLRLMVADPRDLQTGRALPAPRGDAAVQPAARLRLREAAPLPAQTTGASFAAASSEGN